MTRKELIWVSWKDHWPPGQLETRRLSCAIQSERLTPGLLCLATRAGLSDSEFSLPLHSLNVAFADTTPRESGKVHRPRLARTNPSVSWYADC